MKTKHNIDKINDLKFEVEKLQDEIKPLMNEIIRRWSFITGESEKHFEIKKIEMDEDNVLIYSRHLRDTSSTCDKIPICLFEMDEDDIDKNLFDVREYDRDNGDNGLVVEFVTKRFETTSRDLIRFKEEVKNPRRLNIT